jgi:hypothetical protein
MAAGLIEPDELDQLLADPALASLASGRALLQLYVMEAWMRAVSSFL